MTFYFHVYLPRHDQFIRIANAVLIGWLDSAQKYSGYVVFLLATAKPLRLLVRNMGKFTLQGGN
jgi:hypothetical protein